MSQQSVKLSYYSHYREEMMEFIPVNTATLLDVGCGTGLFGRNLKNMLRDIEIWGVEPFEPAANQAIENIDCVFCSTVEEVLEKLPENYFDCIVFNDVLEHLINPETILEKISSKMSPNGVIVASIPNIRYFLVLLELILHKDWKYDEWGVLDKTHVRFFTEKSIVRLFNMSGYAVVSKKGINALPIDYKKHHILLSILSTLLPKYFDDMKYMNFAVSAKLIDT